ncbi:MAG: choice-of-anchor Q domain-containing protein [Acidobacteriota bacterium]
MRALVSVCLLLCSVGSLQAGEILVPAECDAPEKCSLAAAIARSNQSPGRDVLVLEADAVYRLESSDHQNEGGNGLPAITDDLVIEGRGARLERLADDDQPFRLLRVAASGRLELRHLVLTGGATPRGFDGAAIWNVGELVVDSCVIEDNQSGDDGGGIRNDGTLVLRDSLLRRNSARWRGGVGGGLQNAEQFGPARVRIERTTFADNDAWASGGGLWLEGSVTIESSTISGNRAGNRGGGIQNYGELEIYGSTVTDNQAHVTGGGLFTFGSVVLGNSILANNQAMISAECKGSLRSAGHNLLGKKLFECTLQGEARGDLLETRASLGPLREVDGQLVHLPRAGSPALDAGSPAPPGSGDGACSVRDQRGKRRGGAAGRCDIGAVELLPAAEVGR